ncbi:hypothetical protein IH992_04790 [Candidatus Poribacteria bacterium]|nr:hypothetical protein [Candidatus Poribacteria bacterium]
MPPEEVQDKEDEGRKGQPEEKVAEAGHKAVEKKGEGGKTKVVEEKKEEKKEKKEPGKEEG